jgi:hypothetical protein
MTAALLLRGLLFRFGGRCRPAPRRWSGPGGELTFFEAVGRGGLILLLCRSSPVGMFGVT